VTFGTAIIRWSYSNKVNTSQRYANCCKKKEEAKLVFLKRNFESSKKKEAVVAMQRQYGESEQKEHQNPVTMGLSPGCHDE
jgi:hypothetical protein